MNAVKDKIVVIVLKLQVLTAALPPVGPRPTGGPAMTVPPMVQPVRIPVPSSMQPAMQSPFPPQTHGHQRAPLQQSAPTNGDSYRPQGTGGSMGKAAAIPSRFTPVKNLNPCKARATAPCP